MQLTVVAVGKPKLAYARLGADTYLERLRHYLRLEFKTVKASTPEEEAERLFAASEGAVRIALDPRGWAGTTEAWLGRWLEWERLGTQRIAFLIGGAEGHGSAVSSQCETWSLGPLTMQHELALVVLLEQLYRVQTLKRGEPYHRG